MMPTRRQYLASLAAAGTLTTAGTAAADHTDRQPAHVTISYDETVLDTYKPLLARSQAAREKYLGLYGWVAESPEEATKVCVYWSYYSHQDGASQYTSHRGDHEPVAVEVNTDTGDVERIRASIWHWQKGEVTPDAAPMDGTNVKLRVIDPHHAYTAARESDTVEDLDVKDLTATWDDTLANGLEDDVVPGASYNPWIMQRESDWWRAGSFGLPSIEALVTSATQRFNATIGGGTVGSLEE